MVNYACAFLPIRNGQICKGVEGIPMYPRTVLHIQRRYKRVGGICRRVRTYMGEQRRIQGIRGDM